MEGIENSNLSSKTENQYSEVLGENLVGKTEAQLTLEEKETETRFCKENFHKFLNWINNDEIFVHGISSTKDSIVLSSILEKGILSASQLKKSGIRDGGYDRPFQNWGGDNAREVVDSFIEIHKKFEAGIIDEQGYREEKNKIIETIPDIGKLRIAHFLDIVIPRVINEVGYPIESYETKMKIRGGLRKYYPNWVKGQAQTDLGIRNPLTNTGFSVSEKNTPEEYKNIETWESLPDVISGLDLISSTSSEKMKKDFAEEWGGFLSSDMAISNVQIYFKKPHQLRQYEQGGKNRGGGDIGISNRVSPSNFRVIRFGYYDTEKRILDVGINEGVTLKDIPQLSKLQDEGLILIDSSLVPIPPIKSILVQSSADRSSFLYLREYGRPSPLDHPTKTAYGFKRTIDRMRDGTINDFAKKIGLNPEEPDPLEFERIRKEDYLSNLILKNQQKSLAMIEEMGGIRTGTPQ